MMRDEELQSVVPWGRRMHEYVQMFYLAEEDFRRPILDCGAGPCSFNAEMTALGHSVTSCDPNYRFSAAEIGRRIDEVRPGILENVRVNSDEFVWDDNTIARASRGIAHGSNDPIPR